ncbi:carbohydrate kinase [Actinomycetospora sp. NBRC 106375]|uniref:rhamnulokinase n=1 Tax=Actinomycetospora sp. NBRC 106375 TaxID=3032207 RepID=UPI0024A0DCFC|nr:rhamnulokinase family protein [Actinomycetospora sp. NBRC 106375]GLZ46288.1 carbohydrate kinase [Actinomycetospora sp. NBRC 106375]
MTSGVTVAAVDLGASSGRVVRARVGGAAGLELTEVHRFANGPVRVRDTLHWDVVGLHREILAGLGAVGPVDGIGIDTWGVDYGLLDADGALLGTPVHHRDERTAGVAARVHEVVPAAELYARTGLQELPFTTIYQLVAAAGSAQLGAARSLLLVPDLLTWWLTGTRGAERTNASTTGLLAADGSGWDTDLARRVGIDPGLLAPLRDPGSVVGPVTPSVALETGLDPATPVLAVGSHDTASAVAGVPATTDRFAYVSCGTWSLVGVELEAPVLSEASRAANFSNERGVDGTVRYLRNVTGLWLLQECLRAWGSPELDPLLAGAATHDGPPAVVDAADEVFLAPGDMPARIVGAVRALGQPAPETREGIVRCVLDSLALAHRRAVREAAALSGRSVDVVHVVGGGARNLLLCRLTADACDLPVVAGPVEATATGNALVAARALGAVPGGLRDLRSFLVRHVATETFAPGGDPGRWDDLEARLGR